ncbi:hypothetical protein C4577_06865 [Candidatus Parcubacteria bacterium]|nr:MAG: hypothetical protein C4577_06865 [Candidatus Parcubacteria bacterium]
MRKFYLAIPLLVVIVLSSSSSYAYSEHPAKRILGISSESSTMPEVSYGPGLILPSSPLYFLDKLKQNVRISLALKPEERAKVYEQIAGERLAEVRAEAVNGNDEALNVALDDVSNNISLAAKELENVKLRGRDTEVLASELNDSIKEKREVLGVFESRANNNVALRVRAVRQNLFEEKVRVGDYLPHWRFEQEVNNDLNEILADGIDDVSVSTLRLKQALEMAKINIMEKMQKDKKSTVGGSIKGGKEEKNYSERLKIEEEKVQQQKELKVKEMERIVAELKKLEGGNGDLEMSSVVVPSITSAPDKE